MDILKAIKALKRWKLTVLFVSFGAFFLLALAPTPTAPVAIPRYESRAKILLTPPSGGGNAFGSRGGGVGFNPSQSWFADPTILQEVFKSEELLRRVATEAGSKTPWESLRGAIMINPLSHNGSDVKLFQLSVTTEDPKTSQKISRLITEEFSRYVQEISAKEFASTRKFIEELVAEAEQRRLEAEERLMMVREKYLGAPSDSEVTSQQAALESQRREVGQNIPGLQAELATLETFLNNEGATPPWAVVEKANSTLSSLEAEVAGNRLKLEQAREVYTEENENVVTAKNRLARSERAYQDGLREYAKSLRNNKSQQLQQLISREQSLSGRLNALLSAQMTPGDRREVQKLERELTVWEENQLSLTQQLYQARVEEQSSRRQGSVTVLEQPQPGSPAVVEGATLTRPAPSKVKRLAMGLPLCIFLGLAAAILREYLSTSLKLRPRVEEILEIPVLAVIPSVSTELSVDWEQFKRPPLPTAITEQNGNGKAKVLAAQLSSFENGSSQKRDSTAMKDSIESLNNEDDNRFRRY